MLTRNVNNITIHKMSSSCHHAKKNGKEKKKHVYFHVYSLKFSERFRKAFNSYYFCHRDNILVLDIFFEALNYETIEQKKAYEVAGLLGTKCRHDQNGTLIHLSYTPQTWPLFWLYSCWPRLLVCFFVGDIGGQMGLFIGASILTILELFDYAYEVCHKPFFSYTHIHTRNILSEHEKSVYINRNDPHSREAVPELFRCWKMKNLSHTHPRVGVSL